MNRSPLKARTRMPRSRKRMSALSVKERTERAPRWRAVKAELAKRSGGQCEVVLTMGDLEDWMYHDAGGDYERFDWGFEPHRCDNRARDAHHVRKRSQGRDDSLGNLLHVCRECHQWFDKAAKSKSGRLMAVPAEGGATPRTWISRESKFEARRADELGAN